MPDASRAPADPGGAVDESLLEALITEAQIVLPVDLSALANRCASALGLNTVRIYVVDLQQVVLVPLDESLEALPVDASQAGWAYRTVSPHG